MTYLVHSNRNWRCKTLSVPVRKQLLSGKHVCSPQRNPLAVNAVLKANAVCLNADSLHSSPKTQENFACVPQFVLFNLILCTTVVATFASVFIVNICSDTQNDDWRALQVLADLELYCPRVSNRQGHTEPLCFFLKEIWEVSLNRTYSLIFKWTTGLKDYSLI